MRRTITAISSDSKGGLTVLCDDGTVWRMKENAFAKGVEDYWQWYQLPPIPQDCVVEMTAGEKVADGLIVSECEARAAKARAAISEILLTGEKPEVDSVDWKGMFFQANSLVADYARMHREVVEKLTRKEPKA